MRIFLLIITFLITSATFAQFKKGDKIIETSFGNLNLSRNTDYYNDGEAKAKSFNLSIEFAGGYFVHPKLAVGARLNTFLTTQNSSAINSNAIKIADNKSSQMTLVFAPFIRYYFNENATSRFYGQLAGYYSTSLFYHSDIRFYDGTTGALRSTSKNDYLKSNSKGISPSLGWHYFFTSNIALHLNFGFNFYNNNSSYGNTITFVNGQPQSSSSASNSRTGELNWAIGFMFVLPDKKRSSK